MDSPSFQDSPAKVIARGSSIVSLHYHEDIICCDSIISQPDGTTTTRRGSIDEEIETVALSTISVTHQAQAASEEKLKFRILLADDSSSNRRILTQILQKRGGHDVFSAANGLEAIEKLNESKHPGNELFDVVVLDLHMPVMDGFEAMRRIRQQESAEMELYRHLVLESQMFCCAAPISSPKPRKQWIIGCSANDDSETVEETLEAGADVFLPKPFSLDQFLACMSQLNQSLE
jgi:CheY-like chemotaxis protein